MYGIHWKVLDSYFNYLENDIEVCLTHPKYVKAIKGKKTDKKDSKWIADLYKFDLVRCSFIPPKDFRQLRELARYRFKLVCMKSSEKNRIQNCMTVSNIGIASILSDPFGKTATEIMSYLLEHTSESMDEKAVRKLIKKEQKQNPMKSLKLSKVTISKRIRLKNSNWLVPIWIILMI